MRIADAKRERDIARLRVRDGLERGDRLGPIAERRVAGREIAACLEVIGRALRDRLELGDQLAGVAARGVDQHEHAPCDEIVGTLRGDLVELVSAPFASPSCHSAFAELLARIEIPRLLRHERRNSSSAGSHLPAARGRIAAARSAVTSSGARSAA